MTSGIIPAFTAGDRFRKAREITGMDRQTFAVVVGLNRETVTRYEERGTTKPQAVRAWADTTGVDPAWLMPTRASTAGLPDVALAAARDAIVREHGVEQLTAGAPATAVMGDPAEIAATALAAALRSGAMTVPAATVGAHAQ